MDKKQSQNGNIASYLNRGYLMTIKEVSEKYGISSDTLRYYEKIGLLPNIARTSGGIRNYSESDCNWISYVKCMRSSGVAIEPLIEYINLFIEGDATILRRKEILTNQLNEINDKLNELNETKEKLTYKIENYDKVINKYEKNLK